MGWTCTNHYGEKSKDFILRRFTSTSSDGKTTWAFVDHAMVGSTFYGVCQRTTEGVSQYFGVIILTKRHKDGEICWKDMDESMGPYESRAPLRIINKLDELAPDPIGYAKEWRDRCRSHAQSKKARAILKPGSIVKYAGNLYRLEQPAGPRRGWYVIHTQLFTRYRMTARQLSIAEVQQGETK